MPARTAAASSSGSSGADNAMERRRFVRFARRRPWHTPLLPSPTSSVCAVAGPIAPPLFVLRRMVCGNGGLRRARRPARRTVTSRRQPVDCTRPCRLRTVSSPAPFRPGHTTIAPLYSAAVRWRHRSRRHRPVRTVSHPAVARPRLPEHRLRRHATGGRTRTLSKPCQRWATWAGWRCCRSRGLPAGMREGALRLGAGDSSGPGLPPPGLDVRAVLHAPGGSRHHGTRPAAMAARGPTAGCGPASSSPWPS